MTKILHPKVKVQQAGYFAQSFHIDLAESPEPISLADLLEPSTWAHRINQFKEGDTIRVTGQQREFDLTLVVLAKAPGGLIMDTVPRPMPGSPEWLELMRGVDATQTLTKTELAAELSQQTEVAPTTPKKAKAA
jgi:hypothetical protein